MELTQIKSLQSSIAMQNENTQSILDQIGSGKASLVGFCFLRPISSNENSSKFILESILELLKSLETEEDNASWFQQIWYYFYDIILRKTSLNLILDDEEFMDALPPNDYEIDPRYIIIKLIQPDLNQDLYSMIKSITMSRYPIPLMYTLPNEETKINLDPLKYIFLFNDKQIMTSLGTNSVIKSGKSKLLSNLFGTKDEYTRSYLHNESIDFYIQTRDDRSEFYIADIHGNLKDENNLAHPLLVSLCEFSTLILIHFSSDDLNDSEQLESLIGISNNQKILLWRDYDRNKHKTLLEKTEMIKKKFSNVLGVVMIQNQTSSVKLGDAPAKLREQLEIFSNKNCEKPDLRKFLERWDPKAKELISHYNDLNKLFDDFRQEMNADPEEFWKKSFPFLYQDFQIIHHQGLGTNKIAVMTPEKYKINRKSLEEPKQNQSISNFVLKISKLIHADRNDTKKIIERMLLEFQNYFADLVNEVKKSKLQSPDTKSSEILAALQENEDFSLETIFYEISSALSANKAIDAQILENLRDYFEATLLSGSPVNVVFGLNLQPGHQILKETIIKIRNSHRYSSVISIMGSQSSAKSTLLNYLFGCDFSVSSGRCTKGIYMSMKKASDETNVILLDSEGLMSVQGGRDDNFNHMVGVGLISLSHVLLINLKGEGELNTNLSNYLEICIIFLSKLPIDALKPKIYFIIRDLAELKEDYLQRMVEELKSRLKSAGEKLNIKTEDFIDITTDNVFLFPSSIIVSQNCLGRQEKEFNSLFSENIIRLRASIMNFISGCGASTYIDIAKFYEIFEHNWNQIKSKSNNFMGLKSAVHFELKEKAQKRFNELEKIQIETFKKLIQNELKNVTKDEDAEIIIKNNLILFRNKGISIIEQEFIDSKVYGDASSFMSRFEKDFSTQLEITSVILLRQHSEQIFRQTLNTKASNLKAIIREELSNIIKQEDGLIENEVMRKVSTFFEAKIKDNNNRIKVEANKILSSYNTQAYQIIDVLEKKLQQRGNLPDVPKLEDTIMRHSTDLEPIGWDQEFPDISPYYNFSKWIIDSSQEKESDNIKRLKFMFKNFIDNLKPIEDNETIEGVADSIISLISKFTKKNELRLHFNQSQIRTDLATEAINFWITSKLSKQEQQLFLEGQRCNEILKNEEEFFKMMYQAHGNLEELGKVVAGKFFYEFVEKAMQFYYNNISTETYWAMNELFPEQSVSFSKQAYENYMIKNTDRANIIEYITNPNQKLDELLDEMYRYNLSNTLKSYQSKFYDLLKIITDNFLETVEPSKIFEDLAFKWTGEFIPPTENINIETQKKCLTIQLYPVIIGTDAVGFKKGFRFEIERLKSEIGIENLESKFGEPPGGLRHTFFGCKECCPMCGSKCNQVGPHKYHIVYKHYLIGFNGKRINNSLGLVTCIDKSLYKKGYERRNYENYIKEEHESWTKAFPRSVDVDQLENGPNIDMQAAWVLTFDYFGYIYNTNLKVPKAWRSHINERGEITVHKKKKTWLQKLLELIS